MNPATNRFYSTDGYGGNILVYDGATNALMATTYKGYCHAGMDTDPTTNLVYMASQCGGGNDPLQVLNGATNTLVAGPIGTAGVGWGVQVNPTTGRAYVNSSSKTRVFGPSPSFSVLTDLPGISIVAVNPVSNRLYFQSGSDLQVRDGNDHSLVATISGAIYAVGINTIRNRIYATDPANNQVKIYDGATNTIVGTLSLGVGITLNPWMLAVDSARNLVYAIGSGSNILYVVEDPLVEPTPTPTPTPTSTRVRAPRAAPDPATWALVLSGGE